MHAGLCERCIWQRVVVSGKGSRFSMCRRAADDPAYAKYPRVPVLACAGYEPGPSDGGAEPSSSAGSSASTTSPSITS